MLLTTHCASMVCVLLKLKTLKRSPEVGNRTARFKKCYVPLESKSRQGPATLCVHNVGHGSFCVQVWSSKLVGLQELVRTGSFFQSPHLGVSFASRCVVAFEAPHKENNTWTQVANLIGTPTDIMKIHKIHDHWTTTHFRWGFHVLVIPSTSIPGLLEISGGNLWWKVQVPRIRLLQGRIGWTLAVNIDQWSRSPLFQSDMRYMFGSFSDFEESTPWRYTRCVCDVNFGVTHRIQGGSFQPQNNPSFHITSQRIKNHGGSGLTRSKGQENQERTCLCDVWFCNSEVLSTELQRLQRISL